MPEPGTGLSQTAQAVRVPFPASQWDQHACFEEVTALHDALIDELRDAYDGEKQLRGDRNARNHEPHAEGAGGLMAKG